jgi:hypothetical protein
MKKLTGHEKADYSQRLVVSFLQDKGFTIAEVNKPSSNGLDIVAVKDNEYLLIEVKSVIHSTRSWIVKKIHPKSEYVAVVMPNDQIHLECSSDWIKHTDKNGSRSIGGLVKLYKLIYGEL